MAKTDAISPLKIELEQMKTLHLKEGCGKSRLGLGAPGVEVRRYQGTGGIKKMWTSKGLSCLEIPISCRVKGLIKNCFRTHCLNH